MVVEKQASNKTILILGIVATIAGIVLFGFAIKGRLDEAETSRGYKQESGMITSVEEHKHRSSKHTSYSYSCDVVFLADGQEVVVNTGDELDMMVDEGEQVSIMYRESNPQDFYISTRDWMTGAQVPYGVNRNMKIFAALFFLNTGLLLFGFLMKKGKVQALFIGGPLIVIGVSGAVCGLMDGNGNLLFLLIFAAFGVFLLIRELFGNPEKIKQQDDMSQYGKLIIVKDKIMNGNECIFVLALIGEGGVTSRYLGYQTSDINMFMLGGRATLDIRKVDLTVGEVPLNRYMVTNVSYLQPTDFGEVDKITNKILDRLHVGA